MLNILLTIFLTIKSKVRAGAAACQQAAAAKGTTVHTGENYTSLKINMRSFWYDIIPAVVASTRDVMRPSVSRRTMLDKAPVSNIKPVERSFFLFFFFYSDTGHSPTSSSR